MKVESVISAILEAASVRIKSNGGKFIANLAKSNTHNSSYAVQGSINEISNALHTEIKELFEFLNKNKIRIRSLKRTKVDLYSYVNGIFEDWKEELIKRRIFEIGGESATQQFELLIANKVDEAKTIIDSEFLITKERTLVRRRQLFWDIFKIGVTAIVGGIIGAYINSFF